MFQLVLQQKKEFPISAGPDNGNWLIDMALMVLVLLLHTKFWNLLVVSVLLDMDRLVLVYVCSRDASASWIWYSVMLIKGIWILVYYCSKGACVSWLWYSDFLSSDLDLDLNPKPDSTLPPLALPRPAARTCRRLQLTM
ncbi:uncharacterized protein A4U43_C07F33550 [Asparagus officinalis]|uniref:Uncharacterized protein n=1 Tax=Asparagus officinalis TaxID=4686 RepID=A0A5P1EH89_ASPOF|nr:uncharacterized protein A4U43_C07F33550 [Asparagus officinalis]